MHLSHGLALLALLSVPSFAVAQAGDMGQAVLDNRSSLGAELYVDDMFACYAPPHDSCVGEVPAGTHAATILFDDGDFILSDAFEVPAGMSVTLPVRDLLT